MWCSCHHRNTTARAVRNLGQQSRPVRTTASSTLHLASSEPAAQHPTRMLLFTCLYYGFYSMAATEIGLPDMIFWPSCSCFQRVSHFSNVDITWSTGKEVRQDTASSQACLSSTCHGHTALQSGHLATRVAFKRDCPRTLHGSHRRKSCTQVVNLSRTLTLPLQVPAVQHLHLNYLSAGGRKPRRTAATLATTISRGHARQRSAGAPS